MIPYSDIPPEHRDYLTEEGRAQWRRIVRTLDHRALDVDAGDVADYCAAIAYVLSVAELLRVRGAVEIRRGEAVESSAVRLLESAVRELRAAVARTGVKQPLPDSVDVHELTARISEN